MKIIFFALFYKQKKRKKEKQEEKLLILKLVSIVGLLNRCSVDLFLR